MMYQERRNNYDLLRGLAMLGVIVNHVADIMIFSSTTKHLLVAYIYEGFGAFAVPAFLMITGTFVIENTKNSNYKYFYKKNFIKIGIQVIIFTILYLIEEYILIYMKTRSISYTFKSLFNLQVMGWVGHPLWYVYMLMGIYLFIPFIVKIKNYYKNSKYYHIAICSYCIWAFASLYVEEVRTSWSIMRIFGYLGFVLLGNEISCLIKKKNNLIGIVIVILGFSAYILEFFILYNHVSLGGNYYEKSLNSHVAPLSIIGIVFIFSGISMLNVKRRFPIIVKFSFYIYLIHRGILDIIIRLMKNWDKASNSEIYIPCCVLITLFISYVGALIYYNICKSIRYTVKKE